MKKKNKAPFLVTDDNRLFVQVKCSGIDFFVIAVDGFTLHYFDKKKELPYLEVSDAIEWHQNELREKKGNSQNELSLYALQISLDKFNAGKG